MICRSWGWVPRFQNLHLQGPGKLRNIMMGGPGQMGGPSNIMGGPAPPNETMNKHVRQTNITKEDSSVQVPGNRRPPLAYDTDQNLPTPTGRNKLILVPDGRDRSGTSG